MKTRVILLWLAIVTAALLPTSCLISFPDYDLAKLGAGGAGGGGGAGGTDGGAGEGGGSGQNGRKPL